MVELLSYGPARSFGLPYGALKVGSVADVVVLDPHKQWFFAAEQVRSKSKNTPFIGKKMVGATVHVFVAGRQVVSDGSLINEFSLAS
jgi:dihydroorotase